MNRGAEDLARAWGEAFARSDRHAFLALMHPRVEAYLPRAALEGGSPYRGLQGAADMWDDAFDIWEGFEIEPREFDSAGGEVLIFVYLARCFPRGEGPPVEYVGHNVIELRDGKVVYTRPYTDRDEARADADARAAPGREPE